MLKFESIIFDVDGTLWDSRAHLARAYNEILAREGITDIVVTVQRLTQLFGKPMDAIADGLFGFLAPKERYALMDRCIAYMDVFIAKNADESWGYPGLRQTMEKLKKSHRLFIVSNGQKGYGELAAGGLGLADLMDGYLCFGDTNKPKGYTIAKLMENHNITSAVYVGDTQGDLEACRYAGIDFIWTSYGFGAVEEYYAKIDSFSELLEL